MATESYLVAIRGQTDMLPKLEENKLKLLHMKEPLGGWREWSVLTYDHNILADMLIKENKLLKKKIKEYERRLKMITPAPPTAYPGWPNFKTLLSKDEKEDDKEDNETEDEE